MDLTPFVKIKIGELVYIREIFDKPLIEAMPLMREVCNRNGITWEQGKRLCYAVKCLEEA